MLKVLLMMLKGQISIPCHCSTTWLHCSVWQDLAARAHSAAVF